MVLAVRTSSLLRHGAKPIAQKVATGHVVFRSLLSARKRWRSGTHTRSARPLRTPHRRRFRSRHSSWTAASLRTSRRRAQVQAGSKKGRASNHATRGPSPRARRDLAPRRSCDRPGWAGRSSGDAAELGGNLRRHRSPDGARSRPLLPFGSAPVERARRDANSPGIVAGSSAVQKDATGAVVASMSPW